MRRSRPVILFALVVVASLGATARASAAPNPTAAFRVQPEPSGAADADRAPLLRLAEVSPWVRPDGTWTARFDTTGTVPLDATLSVSIRRPLTGDEEEVRDQLEELRRGEGLPASLQGDRRFGMGQVLTPTAVTVELPLRARAGDPSRVLVPNPGVHPVVITLAASEGTVLHRQILFLNRAPAETERTPLQLGLTMPVRGTTTVRPDSTWVVPEGGRLALSRAVELLSSHPDVAVTLQPDPDLLDAVAAGIEADDDLLDRFATLLRARETLRAPWSAFDTEAWATTGTLTDLQMSLVAGQRQVEVHSGAEIDGSTWIDDPSLGPGALGRLTAVGVERLVVDPGRLSPSNAPEERGTTRTFAIEGGGESYDAAAYDTALQLLVSSGDRGPAETAHLVLSELQAIWFAAVEDDDDEVPAVVLAIDDRVPDANANALLALLGPGRTPLVEATSLADLFERATPLTERVNRRERAVVRQLAARPDVPNIRPLSIYLGRLRERAAAYHSSIPDTPGLVPLDFVLLASQGRDLDEPAERALLDAAARRIDADFGAISAPARRDFTVTSRRATLPLQFGNGLDRPVKVEVRFVGTRLEIEGGNSRELVLQPGVTRADLPVVARTSGQFRIRVEVRAANGQLLIAGTDLRVRSTVFSGIGLLIGGGAIAFLAVWWIRSWRRGRRSGGDDPGSPGGPPGPDAPEDAGEPPHAHGATAAVG